MVLLFWCDAFHATRLFPCCRAPRLFQMRQNAIIYRFFPHKFLFGCACAGVLMVSMKGISRGGHSRKITRCIASCHFFSFFKKIAPAMPSKKPVHCPKRYRFGRNLSLLREEREWTQEVLAEQAGISVRYLQSLEAGEYWPSLPTLSNIKKFLACEWGDLLAGCDVE